MVHDIECVRIDLLRIPRAIQQDPHEFLKLLLAKLESTSIGTEARSFKALFQGEDVCRIECDSCLDARDQINVFEELCLCVEKDTNLSDAIDGYFVAEKLRDQDACFCAKCHAMTDSTRTMSLRKAPPLLNIQLLRYKYDKEKKRKSKINCRVEIPQTLSLGEDTFRLVSAIYHLGTSANSGHYVCDVLDWESNVWLHCDDDNISVLEPNWWEGCSDIRKATRSQGANEYDDKAKTVYSLTFVNELLLANALSSSKPIATTAIFASVAEKRRELLQRWNEREERLSLAAEMKRERIDDYVKFADAIRATKRFHVLPTEWLQQWITGSDIATNRDLAAVNNKSLLCQHQRLKPSVNPTYKVISHEAYNCIFRSSATVSRQDMDIDDTNYRCEDCVTMYTEVVSHIVAECETVGGIISSIDEDQRFGRMRKPGSLFWMAKASMQLLRRYHAKLKKIIDRKFEFSSVEIGIDGLRSDVFGDGAINECLLCKHQSVVFNANSRAIKISEDSWVAIAQLFPNAVHLVSDSPECQDCVEERKLKIDSNLRSTKLRSALRTHSAVSRLIDCPYVFPFPPSSWSYSSSLSGEHYILPKSWMETFRKFMADSVGDIPDSLSDERLRCRHGLAIIPELECPEDGVLEILTAEEWGIISANFFETISDCCPALRVLLTPECGGWITDPEVCPSCSHERALEIEDEIRHFQNATLNIYYCEEIPSSFKDLLGISSGSCAVSSRGRPIRKRKRTDVQLITVEVSHGDTIDVVKLKIYEQFAAVDLPPRTQRLFKACGMELTENSRTLFDYEVRSTSKLFVSMCDSDDEEYLFLSGGVTEVECGFVGSFIEPNAAAPMVRVDECIDLTDDG